MLVAPGRTIHLEECDENDNETDRAEEGYCFKHRNSRGWSDCFAYNYLSTIAGAAQPVNHGTPAIPGRRIAAGQLRLDVSLFG